MPTKKKTMCRQLAPNFETLKRAFRNHDVALLEGRRRSDGTVVALLVAVNRGDGPTPGEGWSLAPFAEMIYGNPYELYDPPNPNGGFGRDASGLTDQPCPPKKS